ncbi:MAG: dTMP kinase [Magnetococcales bacterium]|nr:dTMP kinase [Magnetococcales bacterium]
MSNTKRGIFIAFEGIDGAGKSSQISLLSSKLIAEGIQIYDTFEPTNSPIGSVIRQMMSGRIQGAHETIAALFVADRVDHLLNSTNGILSKIERGVSVISDRYYFSSYAYHSAHIDMDWVISANSISANILRPDINLFIDVPPEVCIERLEKARFHFDIYENLAAIREVRKNYLNAFKKLQDHENIVIIDGNGEIQDIRSRIWHVVEPYFNAHY